MKPVDFYKLKSKLPAGFIKWFTSGEGISVWTDFEKRACMMARRRDHYSADAICHVIRWHTAIMGGDDFKLNNNWVSGLARVWMEKYRDDHPDFFRLRDSLGMDE